MFINFVRLSAKQRIDQSHKSHNAIMPYPTIHWHFTEVYFGIRARCIVGFVRLVNCQCTHDTQALAWLVKVIYMREIVFFF